MDKKKLKAIAVRLVLDGQRKADTLSSEAHRLRRMADMLPREEAVDARFEAVSKFQRAARIRQMCGRLAAAHGIGQKETGRGWRPRPVGDDEKPEVSVRRLSHA